MKKIILSLAISLITIFGAVSFAHAGVGDSPHLPSEEHVLANELKEQIHAIRDMVRDLRDTLREIRKIR